MAKLSDHLARLAGSGGPQISGCPDAANAGDKTAGKSTNYNGTASYVVAAIAAGVIVKTTTPREDALSVATDPRFEVFSCAERCIYPNDPQHKNKAECGCLKSPYVGKDDNGGKGGYHHSPSVGSKRQRTICQPEEPRCSCTRWSCVG